MFPLLEAVIEGQKRSAHQLAAFGTRYDFIESSYNRLARQINRLQESQAETAAALRGEMLELRGEMRSQGGEIQKLNSEIQKLNSRLDAVLLRLDEINGRLDRLSDDVRAARLELVGQYNEILNAVQAGTINGVDLSDLTERVERLEREFATRFGA